MEKYNQLLSINADSKTSKGTSKKRTTTTRHDAWDGNVKCIGNKVN